MMLIHKSLILVIFSSSVILVHCSKSDGSTSQQLPAPQNVNTSRDHHHHHSSIPIIEAKSVKLIKNVSSNGDTRGHSGKTSSQPLPPSITQVNSKRFGDLSISSFLWKKNADPKFGFPANIPIDHQSAGSPPAIQMSSLPGRTLSWNDQSSAASTTGSSPLHFSNRLRGILPNLRLKDVLGKSNHQSMLQLTPSESSQVVSSIDAGISPSLGSSSPPTGGGVSNSELGLSAVSSQLGNGLLMNQPQGTSSSGSSPASGTVPSSLTPDQVSKLTDAFEHGFNQQVQQQLYQINQQQQKQASAATAPTEVGGTTSIFRKLVSSGRRRIPSFPSLLRPSALPLQLPTTTGGTLGGSVNPLISSPTTSHTGSAVMINPTGVTKENHISLHKLIPFLWPYKLSPPNLGSPIPPPPPATSTTSKLRELFKPKFFKSLDQSQIVDQQAVDQQQMPTFLAHPDMTKHQQQYHLQQQHHSDVGSLFVTKQPSEGNSNGNSPSDQTSANTNIQFRPHLHFIEGHEQTAPDDDDQYPKDNEPILPEQPQESNVSVVNSDGSSGNEDKQNDGNEKLQMEAVRAITSLLQGQNKQNKKKNIMQYHVQQQESDVPKTYDEYLQQQQKQHELIEAAKAEALEAAKNYAMKSGQSKIAIKPVKLIQMVLNGNRHKDEQPQQLNVGQQYLQQTLNDISGNSAGSGSEESRNMPVVYTANQQSAHPQLPRRLRRPIRPQPPPGYQEHMQGNREVLEVSPSTGSQNSEFQFVRLPVQESPNNGEEYEHPNVGMSEADQSEMIQYQHNQFQQSLSPQQQMLLSALESAPRPPLPPHVSLAPEVTFIQRPSATVAFFPPTLNGPPPGYHGLDVSQSAHHSSIQGSHRPSNMDPNLGQYEFIGQSPPPQIPVHLLMQQQFGQLPPHLLHHQAHMTHQLHPHHPGGRVVKTVLIKEQLEHIAPGQQGHQIHQHPQPPVTPQPAPARAPITGYGMHGWIPKDVPNDWTPGGPFRSAAHSYNDEIKFNSFDRITTRSPADVVQINHHWYPSSDKTIQGLTTPVTERPSLAKPTESEPATSAIVEQPKEQRDRPQFEFIEEEINHGEEIHSIESSSAAPVITNTKPVSTSPTSVSDKYINQRSRLYVKPKPVVRVASTTAATTTTSTTEAPELKEENVHVGIVDDHEVLKTHVDESLKESSSGIATIEVIPSTKRHLFERISPTTPFGSPSTTSFPTSTTTTTTPRPVTSTIVPTSTTVAESMKKDKISRRNSLPSIVLSSIDIELGPKGSSRRSSAVASASSLLANLDKKVGLLKDNITWEQ